jgi:PIN domain nuclease of toxin-antitoxin system
MLLDSHVLLWFSSGSNKLGPQAKRKIERANQLFYSSLSSLELGIKSVDGRLTLPSNYFELLKTAGFSELAFDSEHATELRGMQTLVGHDPIDRGILATAISANLPLLTADRKLLALDLPFIFDAQE